MHNANIPDYTELPSSAKLIKETVIAIIAATVILITVVLPAEFGIDPTGIGQLTGLKRMGEIKTALAEEAEENEPQAASAQPKELIAQTPINPTDSMEPRTDELSVTDRKSVV